jgi:hypothetical protein
MPKIPNIIKTAIIIISTLNIPTIDYDKEEIMIFMSGFLDIIRNGLRVLNNFNIFKSIPKLISITAVDTMKKSSFDHESFKYAFYPINNPCEIILSELSKINTKLKNKSKLFAIL